MAYASTSKCSTWVDGRSIRVKFWVLAVDIAGLAENALPFGTRLFVARVVFLSGVFDVICRWGIPTNLLSCGLAQLRVATVRHLCILHIEAACYYYSPPCWIFCCSRETLYCGLLVSSVHRLREHTYMYACFVALSLSECARGGSYS